MDRERRQQLISGFTALIDAEATLPARSWFELRNLSAESLRVQSWLAAFDTRIAHAVASLPDAGDATVANIATGGGRRGAREAAAIVDRSKTCGEVPEIGEALAAGDCTTAHVDAITAATKHLDDAAKGRFAAHGRKLADEARFDTPAEFSRRCRDLAAQLCADDGVERQERLRRQRTVTRWSDPDGMCHTKLSLDPLADAQVWSAIGELVDRIRNHQTGDRPDDAPGVEGRTFQQLCADAFAELCTAANVGAGGRGLRRPEVSVLIDLDTLSGRAAAAGLRVSETADGKALPAATIRRLCCDADLIPVVLNGDGRALDVGRAQRLATGEQRHALQAMYATCAHPDCSIGFDNCRIHHIAWWHRHRGATDLDNLIPLCERHHHLVHEGRWDLTMTPARVATWRLPSGTIAYHGPSTNRRTPRPGRPPTTARSETRRRSPPIDERSMPTQCAPPAGATGLAGSLPPGRDPPAPLPHRNVRCGPNEPNVGHPPPAEPAIGSRSQSRALAAWEHERR